ncbi:MAG: protein-disulfide reductase DsbD family protein [Gammaproteobacteria bacterium]|nr:MAG: cytochrome C biogenesis protein [Gammaproteobacteria bacterium]|tara:strand:+ start:879 stop:2894 length:2016 start_codon:yes stop_codon:yes gene_type:complete
MVKLKTFYILLIGMLLLASCNVLADEKAIASNSSLELFTQNKTISDEKEIYLLAKFSLQKDWHTYWINPGDSGEAATFEWDLPDGFQVTGPFWPEPEVIPYPPLTTYGYTDNLNLLFKISIPNDAREINTITVNSKWLVCADVCIPQEGKAKVSIQKSISSEFSNESGLINKAILNLPEKIETPILAIVENNNLVLKSNLIKSVNSNIYFFPFREGVIDYSKKQKILEKDNSYSLRIPLMANKTNISLLKGGILKTNSKAYEIKVSSAGQYSSISGEPQFISIGLAIVFSLIGGLLLNLMPCVFPVISLKILNFVEHSENKTQVTFHGLSFSFGAILMFVLIGLSVVALKMSGIDVGWGYQLQSPLIVSLLIFLFIFLSGFFLLNVNFLNSLSNVGNFGLQNSSYLNSLGTGFLAVIVATPCTAPFMGSALGFAILQPGIYSFLIFLFLGIGFTLPYLLLSAFPKMLSALPKPGLWMETFKQFMAFPMILTALWLIWVLSSQISSFQLVLVLGGVVLIIFFYWINQLDIKTLSVKRFRYFLYVLIAGLIFFTLPLEDYSKKNIIGNFSEEIISEKLSQGPVFLNFTADWCITCKVNERIALKRESISALFDEKNISYIEIDWTNKNDEIAKKLASFGRSSIPLYVYYSSENAEPIILPEILTENIIKDYLR